MSIQSIDSSTSQSLGAQLLQLLANGSGTGSHDSTSLESILGDLTTLSSASQQLAKAPAAVTQAMSDLLSGQKDVQGDLAQLKTYFKQNPQSLASVLSSLQGSSGTYNASGSLNSNSALMTALKNTKGDSSAAQAILNTYLGTQNQDPLLASLGDSGSGSNLLSYLG